MQTLDLARKYRPTSLKEYYGSSEEKNTILRLLEKTETRPQVILLSGPSGCGKTTLARIIAKEYTCQNRDTETGACCECQNCKNVDAYIRSGDTSILTNVKEIDIAENNGKNDINAVLEEMLIPAMGNEWKIYIFDEVHMSTYALQNRLLKIVEEPPENVLIILCTTNPERLLDTLRNRCRVRIELNKPSSGELYALLQTVSKAEGWECTKSGLEYLVDYSEGVVRTALYNLQQVGTEHNSITYETVTQIFNVLPNEYYFDLLRQLQQGNTLGYITTLYTIKGIVSLDKFFLNLKNFVKRGVYVINGIAVSGLTKDQVTTYKTFFEKFSLNEISNLMTKLLTLDMNNLELELIMLGYTGLNSQSATTLSSDVLISKTEKEKEEEISQEYQQNTALKQEVQLKENETSHDNYAVQGSEAVSTDFLDKLGLQRVSS